MYRGGFFLWFPTMVESKRRCFTVIATETEREFVAALLRELHARGLKGQVLSPALVMRPDDMSDDAALVLTSNATVSLDAAHIISIVRRAHPHLPIFCCFSSTARFRSRIVQLARLGMDDVFLSADRDVFQEIGDRISALASHILPGELARELVANVPSQVRTLVSWSLRRGWRPLHVNDLAEFFHEDVTTIGRRLKRARAPTARIIGSLSRAAHLCVELDFAHHTEAIIAQRLGFGAASGVRMHAKRALGLSVTNLRGMACDRLLARWHELFSPHSTDQAEQH